MTNTQGLNKAALSRLGAAMGLLTWLSLAFTSLPAQAQQAPWQTAEGRACIDEWINHVAVTLNGYNGDAEFNSRKPWSVNNYGLFVGQGIASAFEPDTWAQFGADRAQWMWGFYTSEAQFPDWNNQNFDASGLQGLRWYAQDCTGESAGGGGGGGGLFGNTPAPSVPPAAIPLDTAATCPSNFTMHSNSTLTMICYCAPENITGSIWGTGFYTADSAMCAAAAHAGVIGMSGGMVTVQGAPGQQAYQGTEANGITTSNYGAYGWSFIFPGAVPVDTTQATLEACPANMTSHRGTSTAVNCHCAPSALSGSVWGTDIYTDDSAVCAAALHAGIIGQSGGTVTAVALPGLEAYEGTARNGISSSDYGSWHGSFYFE